MKEVLQNLNDNFFGSVSHKEFMELLDKGIVYEYKVSYNSYGEFMFVSIYFPEIDKGIVFYGLGYHEYRDRYVLNKWEYHHDDFFELDRLISAPPKRLVKEAIEDRLAEISALAKQHKQSKSGKVYDMIAELMDDDAAIAFMEDFGIF